VTRELHLDPDTTAQLAAERQELPIEMSVACPRCGATVGNWCKTARYQNSGVPFHKGRTELAARTQLAAGPRMVYVVTDLSSRWFEMYEEEAVADLRASQMNAALNAQYRRDRRDGRDRYQVSRVPVYRTVAGQNG
jgi:hypothetical protein